MAPATVEIEVTEEPVGLYRFYDASGVLLYAGISRNLVTRWAQHGSEKDWWPLVARKTVVMYGSRGEAELAEGRAIRSESPLHNKAMGRRDESAPRRPGRRLAAALKKPAHPLRPVPPESYTFDAELAAQIDAYARKYGCSRAAAVGALLLVGLQKFEEEEREALKVHEELEALRRTIAA